MKRRNQLAILGGSVLLALAGVTTASAMADSGPSGDDYVDPVPFHNVDAGDPAELSTTTTVVATTLAPTSTIASAPADPGPVPPAPSGAPLEEVVANHEARITDLEQAPEPTAPPATAPPTTVAPAPPTTTPVTTSPPTTEARPPRPG